MLYTPRMRCPKCKFLNPEGANFCLKCGANLKIAELPERKFATILFSDLKEFTTLSEQKDPEEVREIIKELFSLFDTILDNFHVGYHEYIGDAVLALFGVPTAYPDDAERAINAALAMQKEIKKFSANIGLNLEFRTGINSGEMIYGEIPGKTTVTGDAVNTAQRLASIAEPTKILITDATAKLIGGSIRTKPLSALKLKGKKEEIFAFEVISPSKRMYPSFLSPMLGRDTELAKLKEIFNAVSQVEIRTGKSFPQVKPTPAELAKLKEIFNAVSQVEIRTGKSFPQVEPAPAFVVITGGTGIGKSRLLFEFQRSLPASIKTILLKCSSYNTFIYQPLIDLIKDLFKIEESDSPETIRTKISIHLLQYVPTLGGPVSKHFLGFFLGIKFPHSLLNHLKPTDVLKSAFATLKDLIEYIAKDSPLVLIFEDAHYMDSGTQDFLEYLTQTDFQGRVIILFAGRLEGFIEKIKSRKGKYNFIELSPLKEAESKALIQSFFKEREISEEGVEILLKKTGGNPLFLEEFIKELKVGIDYNLSLLPDSLWALLEARIDRLPSRERRILRTASVIGRIFWKRALENLSKEKIKKELSSLEQKDYIYEQYPSQLQNDSEYVFHHELLRDAAYKTLLKKQRRELHKETLKYLEEKMQQGEIQSNLYLQLAAYHSELGEEYDKAVSFYTESGDLAKEKYAFQEANRSYSKAIEIAIETRDRDRDERRLGELLEKRAFTETFLCMYDQAIEDYEKLTKFKAPDLKISGLIGIADVAERKGDFDKSIECSLKAKALSEKQKMNELQAKALNLAGSGYLRKGFYKKVLETSELACKIYEKLVSTKTGEKDLYRLKKGITESLNNIGNSYWELGNYDKALDSYMQSIKISKEINDKAKMTRTLNNIGLVHMNIRNYDTALNFYKQSLKIGKEIGDKYGIGRNLINIGVTYENMEEEDKALDFYNQALEINREIGDKGAIAITLYNIGTIHSEFGHYDTALDFYNQALEINKEIGSKRGIARALINIGTVHGFRGNYDVALNYQREAEKIIRESGMKVPLVECLTVKGQVYNKNRDFSKAYENLEEALNICEGLKLKSEMCAILCSLSQVSCAVGDIRTSKNYLKRGLELAKECKSKTLMAAILSAYAEFYLANHDYERAKKSAQDLLDLFKGTKHHDSSLAEAFYLMGRSLSGLRERNRAKKYLSQSLSLAQKMKLKPLINKLSKLD